MLFHVLTLTTTPLQRELMDLSTIDVILISNYHCMMALPYVTEHSGFTGTVYATEPTLQIGRWVGRSQIHWKLISFSNTLLLN